MEWVSGWIQGIIIAVIVSTIIEMILPEGTSKKYIKVVIGVYILFSIVTPVISKITGSNFRVSDIFDLDEYIEVSKNNGSMQNKLESQNESQIKELYLSSIEGDIKEKVENRGYNIENIKLEVENDGQYTLKKLILKITKSDTSKSSKDSNTTEKEVTKIEKIENVNKINVNIGNAQTNTETANPNKKENTSNNNISSKDKKELKEYLSSVYEISIQNIFINE